MMRLIVTSQQDLAGRNIYRELSSRGFRVRGEFEGKPVYEKGDVWLIATEKPQVRASHLDAFFDPEYYVFASRHRSTSGKKTLTVHTPGNLTPDAELGGRPRELALSEPSAVKTALMELKKIKDERFLDYAVSLEATHHGPSELRKPVLFVEVGSTPREWRDQEAVEAVARAALKAAENRVGYEAGIGIGGNHYAPLHTKAVLEANVALGHIIPSYAIEALDDAVFREAVEKSGASFGFLDWKGMKKAQRDKIISLAERTGLPLKRGRDLHGRAARVPRGFRVDENLLQEAWRADPKALEDRLSALGCGYRKMGGGINSLFEGEEDLRKEIIEECIRVLKNKADVKFAGDELTLKTMRFSPEKARALGIKPGPEYARLAAGEEIKKGDRVIKPDMVLDVRVRKIKIEDPFTARAIGELFIFRI